MSHPHSNGCGCSEDAKAADAIQTSLYSSIDRDRILCLNELEAGMGKRVVRPWSDRNQESGRLLSDEDDAELLLFIPFVTAVNIKSIAIMAWGDWRPNKIKLHVNREDLDLSNVGDTTAAQEIELNDDTEGYLDYPLKQAKFQNVRCLYLYVPDCAAGTQSGIQFVHLKGTSTSNKREIVNVVYEARANPADHTKLAEATSSKMGM